MGREERRAFERARVAYTARVQRGDAQLEATVENLGGLGALLATADLEMPLEPGDEIALNIALPDREPVDVKGEVLRVEQELTAGEVRRAFAVRFASPID